MAGILVGGEALFREGNQLLVRGPHARLQFDVRLDLLAPVGRGARRPRQGFGHARMGVTRPGRPGSLVAWFISHLAPWSGSIEARPGPQTKRAFVAMTLAVADHASLAECVAVLDKVGHAHGVIEEGHLGLAEAGSSERSVSSGFAHHRRRGGVVVAAGRPPTWAMTVQIDPAESALARWRAGHCRPALGRASWRRSVVTSRTSQGHVRPSKPTNGLGRPPGPQ